MEKSLKLKEFALQRNGNELKTYINSRDGVSYQYYAQINGVFYCADNKIVDLKNEKIIELPAHQILVDYFIFDTKENKVSVYDQQIKDGFLDSVAKLEKITVKGDLITLVKQDDKIKNVKDRTVKIQMRAGKIIGIEDHSVTKCGDLYLGHCTAIESVKMRNVQEIGDCFLNDNRATKELYQPNLERCGIRFLYNDNSLKVLNLPKLKKCGFQLLSKNNTLDIVALPSLEDGGPYMLSSNQSAQVFIASRLKKLGYDFMPNHLGRVKEEVGKQVKLTTYRQLVEQEANDNVAKNAEHGQWWELG